MHDVQILGAKFTIVNTQVAQSSLFGDIPTGQ
jgi:hypothetical protein